MLVMHIYILLFYLVLYSKLHYLYQLGTCMLTQNLNGKISITGSICYTSFSYVCKLKYAKYTLLHTVTSYVYKYALVSIYAKIYGFYFLRILNADANYIDRLMQYIIKKVKLAFAIRHFIYMDQNQQEDFYKLRLLINSRLLINKKTLIMKGALYKLILPLVVEILLQAKISC